MFIATWCAWPISGRNFLGVSRLIMFVSWSGWSSRQARYVARQARPAGSDQDPAFHESDGPEVAVPPLDRVLLDEAVAAEQLHAVVADLHAPLGAQPPGQPDLAREAPALRRPRRGPV